MTEGVTGIRPEIVVDETYKAITKAIREAALINDDVKDPIGVLNSLQAMLGASIELLQADPEHQRKILSNEKTFDEITQSQSLPLDKLTHLIDTKVEYIINPICPKGTLTLVQGMPKSGKSTFSLWLSLCASVGVWPSGLLTIEKPVNVLFVEFEDSPLLVVKRSARYLSGAGLDGYTLPSNFTLCDNPQLYLESPKYEKALTKEILEKGYELIVIDTLSYVHNADDENGAADMKPVVAALKRIVKATQCSIIFIHHTKKGSADSAVAERARGSSTIPAAADVILDWGDRGNSDITPVRVISKYDDGFNCSVEYKRNDNGIEWVMSREEKGQKERVDKKELVWATIRELEGTCPEGVPGPTIVSVMDGQGVSKPSVYRHMGELAAEGRLSKQLKDRTTLYKAVIVVI